MSQSKVVQVLTLLLIIIGISSPVFIVHAASYTPGVSVGQWAKYETLYDRCQSSDPTMCQSQGNGDLNDTDYGLIRIVDVSGTTVTFQLFTQYKNGTTSSEGAQVDVATGYSNVSSIGSGAPSDYFVLAGGLQMGDHIWDSSTAPTLNLTITEQVLGVSRSVNFLNYTFSYSIPGEYSISTSTGFAFDQASGIFLEVSVAFSSNSQYGSSEAAFALGMVDNNIWLSSTLPDFSINPISSIIFQTGSSGTATITFAGQGGFSSSIILSIDAPSGLTCTLDHYTVDSSGSATLTCNGQPGTYTVTINASGGGSTHSAHTNVTVNSAPTANQPSNGLPLTYVYIAVATAAVVAIAGVIFFLRRKSPSARPEPSVPTPTPQSHA